MTDYSEFEEALRKYRYASEVSARARRDVENKRNAYRDADLECRRLEVMVRDAQREVYWQMERIVEADDVQT